MATPTSPDAPAFGAGYTEYQLDSEALFSDIQQKFDAYVQRHKRTERVLRELFEFCRNDVRHTPSIQTCAGRTLHDALVEAYALLADENGQLTHEINRGPSANG